MKGRREKGGKGKDRLDREIKGRLGINRHKRRQRELVRRKRKGKEMETEVEAEGVGGEGKEKEMKYRKENRSTRKGSDSLRIDKCKEGR